MDIITWRKQKGLLRKCKEFDPPLDGGIEREVKILWENWIETYESCEGGPGHSYPEPTVRFNGDYPAGFEALSVAMYNGLAVKALKRGWSILGGEPTGPWWEMTFFHPKAPQ